ncbi:MAG: MFS transporter [Planctomycetes bacterium]|nr:MFS transporter [Planctomycetota bacterium]
MQGSAGAVQAVSVPCRREYHRGHIGFISVAAALGGLLFGWDWVVIGGAKLFFERYFELKDPALVGWANSCALIGCMAGAFIAGAPRGLSARAGSPPAARPARALSGSSRSPGRRRGRRPASRAAAGRAWAARPRGWGGSSRCRSLAQLIVPRGVGGSSLW